MANKPVFLRSTLQSAAFLAASLVLVQVHAAGDLNAYDATPPSGPVAARTEQAANDSRNAAITPGALQQLQQDSREQALELATLKETIAAQSLLIEQLKSANARTNPVPTSSSSTDTDVAALKARMSEQTRSISALQTQLSEAQRSSESNANDLNSLRQEISNLRSSVGRLDSQVSGLSSKVK